MAAQIEKVGADTGTIYIQEFAPNVENRRLHLAHRLVADSVQRERGRRRKGGAIQFALDGPGEVR